MIFLLMILSAFLLYPIFFIFVGSFMGGSEVHEYLEPIMTNSDQYSKLLFLPNEYTLKFYIELLFDTPEFFVMFWNSVKMVVLVVAGQLIVNIPAAWAFARYKFKFKRILFDLYIILMVMPFVVMMLPEYLVLKKLNMLDTTFALIIPGIFSTFSVFLVQYYFKKIPASLIELATLDGANDFKIFFLIGVPLAKPAIYTSIILNFIDYWGAIEQTLAFTESRKLWSLPIFLSNIKMSNASVAFVASVFSMIPPLLVMMYGKEYLEKGLSSISWKE